jgi:Na+/alanine symporter
MYNGDQKLDCTIMRGVMIRKIMCVLLLGMGVVRSAQPPKKQIHHLTDLVHVFEEEKAARQKKQVKFEIATRKGPAFDGDPDTKDKKEKK